MNRPWQKFLREFLRGPVFFVSALLVIAGVSLSFFTYRGGDDNKNQTIEKRITLLTASLNNSAKVISDIEREIEGRRELVTKLQRDADDAKQLSELKAAQVAAVSQALKGELDRENRTNFWITLATNLFFAILGAALGELFRWIRGRRQNWEQPS
jgi:hypothetical protein